MLTLAFAPDGTSPTAPPGRLVNTWRDNSGEVFAQAFKKGTGSRIDWRGLGVFTFSEGDRAITVQPEPGVASELVRDMFTRVVQPVILQALGWQVLHAGAVRGPSGAIAFCGVGHSGKSTLSYAAGRAPGHAQIADDAVVLEITSTGARVQRLPFRPKLRYASHQFFRESLALDPHAALPADQMTGDPLPLSAIFLIAQNGGAPADAVPRRLAPSAAFPEILRHAHCFDEDDRHHSRTLIEAYLALVDVVPVFQLEYTPQLSRLHSLVSIVLGTASDGAAAFGAPPTPKLQAL